MANRLAAYIMVTEIVPERDDNLLTVISGELLALAENATVDVGSLREKVIFTPQFSNLIFAFEILNEMRFQAGGIDMEQLNNPVFAKTIEEKIDWTAHPEDILTFELWSEIFAAFWPTVDYYLVTVGTDAISYGQKVANAYVSVDFFCVQNGLTLGMDNFMSTGQCNCVDNAEPVYNELLKATSCQCSDGFSASITVDRENMSLTKSCLPDISTVQVQLFQTFESALLWDGRLKDTKEHYGLLMAEKFVEELSKISSAAFENFTIDEMTFRQGSQLEGSR